MQPLLPISILSLALAPIGAAQTPPPADPMAWAYGNTLEVTIPTVGYKSKRYIEPDRTWRDISNYSGEAKGVWEMKDGKSCFIQTDPTPEEGYGRMCYPPLPREPGEVWFSSDAVTGSLLRMEVIKGRQ